METVALAPNWLLFQFHKGTIKTKRFTMISTVFLKFQFHKGTIKTNLEMLNISNDSNFNSIKVQLKQAHFNVNVSSLMSFQFHKGTIKTITTF